MKTCAVSTPLLIRPLTGSRALRVALLALLAAALSACSALINTDDASLVGATPAAGDEAGAGGGDLSAPPPRQDLGAPDAALDLGPVGGALDLAVEPDLAPPSPDMTPPPIYLLGACAPTWGGWISDTPSVNLRGELEAEDRTARAISYIDCLSPGAALHAALSDLDHLDLAERLVAAADAGADVHLLLTRPSAEVEGLLTSRLGERARVCGAAGCAATPGGQEANIILISRTETRDGEREGAVIYSSAPFRSSGFVVNPSPEPLAEIIARHGDVIFYEAALESWRALSEGRRAPRAVSQRYEGINSTTGLLEHVLQLSLDLHMSEHSPQGVLSSLTGCDHPDGTGTNIWLASPHLGDGQLWLMEHIERLEGASCSVKVLTNPLSPLLAAALGGRARLTERPLHLATLTAVALNNIDGRRHEEAWSATPSWFTAEGDYEGAVFWMWNEARMQRHRDPLSALWVEGRAP